MTRAGMRVQRLIGALILAGLALVMTSKLATGPASAAPQDPVTRNANEALANSMAASGYGWTGGQATCLDELWTEESGFSATALNSQSGATGIPQLLPSAHAIPADWPKPAVQIKWGLEYIDGTYGSPCAAWRHERSETPNWY